MIGRKDKVNSIGQMGKNTMDNGKMENNTELAIIQLKTEHLKKENGLKEKEPNGFNERLLYVLF